MIASGRISDVAGPIYAVHASDHTVREIFPQGAAFPDHDTALYHDCPGFNPMASRYEKVGVACIPCTLSVMVHERRLKSSIWMFAALFPH